MSKVLLAGVAGVFLGAFVMETLNRKKPNLVGDIERRTRRAFREFGRAFAEGYTGGTAPGA